MNFVATVSHELLTPLTVIRGAAHNLERGVVREPERIGEYAGLITQHAEQLQEMVEQVLTYAGARKNALLATRAPVALGEILRDAIAAAAPETQAAHCELEIKIADPLPSLNGDAAAPAPAIRQQFDPFPNLAERNRRHAGQILMRFQPRERRFVRPRLGGLAQHIRIQQVTHSLAVQPNLIVREVSRLRAPTSSPSPGAGHFRRWPSSELPRLIRFMRSTDTTTTTGLPCLVMTCSPSVRARSTTSLSRFFASCNDHVAVFIRVTIGGETGQSSQIRCR